MNMPKGGKTGMKKTWNNLYNGDKKGVMIFKGKERINEKNMKQQRKHDFQSLASWDEHNPNMIIPNHSNNCRAFFIFFVAKPTTIQLGMDICGYVIWIRAWPHRNIVWWSDG